MKNAKCPNCGATIEVDENSRAGICKYCNTPYSTEDAIAKYTNSTINNATTINNTYYQNNPNQPMQANMRVARKPRPKINKVILALGLYCGIIPGILYLIYIKKKQKEWDDKYTY